MALVESFSGIRGIYGKELNQYIATRYAYCYAEYLRRKNKTIAVVVGRDSRPSGKEMRDAVIEGLDSDIIDVGVLPTPVIENAVRAYKASGGVIITASHNEPQYNGMKFLDEFGAVLKPKGMESIIKRFNELKVLPEDKFLTDYLYVKKPLKHAKRVEKVEAEALDLYNQFLLRFLAKEDIEKIKKSGIKVLLDPNGGTGVAAKSILDQLGIANVFLNQSIGEFARLVEPTENSLSYLKKEIPKFNANFAGGFDCDADRIEFLLPDGRLVSGNHALALIVDEVLSHTKNPEKQTVVVNDATSYLVKEVADKYKAKWREVEVGETNVVETMIAFNSPVGGEGSNGGIILPPSRCRDGTLTLLFLLKIIASRGKTLAELVDTLPQYHYLKDKVILKKDFISLRPGLMKHYLDSGFTIEESGDETGGIKAIKDNSWVWFRQSKTEDKVLRIITDSKDEKKAKELLKEGRKLVS